MAVGVQVVRSTDGEPTPGYPVPGVRATGSPMGRRATPADFPLWVVHATLPPGTTLTWGTAHGDEAVYVAAGAVQVEGRTCPTGGAVIVEADVATLLEVDGRDGDGGAEVWHYGPRSHDPPHAGPGGPPQPDGHGVHVVGPGGMFATSSDVHDTRFYADATCPTCRITLFSTARAGPYVSRPHSHSQDEIITVLEGSLTIGRQRLVPGDCLAVTADRRYGFRSSEGFTLLNYRRDGSWMTTGRDEPPLLEGGAANDFTAVSDIR